MLSILIPARHEDSLQRTIDDIFQHAEGEIEVLVALDNWENPPEIHVPKGRIITTQAGQRGATNRLAKLAQGKYVMKLDAHCSMSQGFDVKMIEDMEDDVTMIPAVGNLHVYDWVCENGHKHFQGKYEECEQCHSPKLHKEPVWKIISKPIRGSHEFDTVLHFQYATEEAEGLVTESMSIQGSCFLLTRDKYFELNICDESLPSWGSQGTEVACKTWLSGGRVLSTKKAYYGHQFRETEGFPYPNPADEIFRARDTVQDMFYNNKWSLQIHSLYWLLEKFNFPQDWRNEEMQEILLRIKDAHEEFINSLQS